MKQVLLDGRWVGNFGIARYTAEVRPFLSTPHSLLTARVTPASMFDPLYIAKVCRDKKVDCFVSLGFNAGWPGPAKQVIVLHDLISLDVPAETNRAKRAYLERVVRPAIRRTGVVITDSNFSRDRIVHWADLDPSDVVVAKGAVSSDLANSEVAPYQQHDRPYVLFVGNDKPHKRLIATVGAMRILAGFNLVCVGVSEGALSQSIGLAGLDPERVKGYRGVPDTVLAQLYRGAACLAFPSSYEGFGLPALEALAQGTPVVHAAQAVGEIVPDYLGVNIPAEASSDDLAAALLTASEMVDESFRAKARAHAATFRWSDTAAAVDWAISRALNARET